MANKDFKSIGLKKMSLKAKNQKLYRLYKTEKEFNDIEAGTVYEALEKSEFKNPIAIKILINKLEGTQNNDKLTSDGSVYELMVEPLAKNEKESSNSSNQEPKSETKPS